MTRPSAKEWVAAFALFLALTVAMTWPFAARLPIIDAGDSAFFAWAVGWQVHAVKTDPLSLPHGNFYAPSRFTFFMDEPVLGTGLLALPLSLFTNDAIVLFNVVRLLTWILTGLFTWRFARDAGLGNPAALAAGVFFAFSPIRVDQVAHLSTLGTQWIPLVYLFARRFGVGPSIPNAAWTGFFFALSFLACGYHGLFFAVVLPVSLLPFLIGPQAKALVTRGWAAVLAAAVFLLPSYALSRAALGPLRFARSNEDTLKYAASLETFFAANRWNRMWGSLTEDLRGDPSNLFPGLVLILLVAALVFAFRARVAPESRRVVAVLLVLAVAAALLALGPTIRFRGTALMPGPFALLRDIVPVFANIRATSRAGIFFAFALAMLAGFALQSFRRTALVSAVAAAVFLAEARIAPIPTPSWTNVIDAREAVPPVYAWLKAQPPGTIVAELPARQAYDYARPAFHDSIYMVWSTYHWQPLVNGFAGAETPLIQRFRALAPAFPERAALDVMKEAGARYVVVHLRGYGPNQRARLLEGAATMTTRLREAARFGGSDPNATDVDIVYELIG